MGEARKTPAVKTIGTIWGFTNVTGWQSSNLKKNIPDLEVIDFDRVIGIEMEMENANDRTYPVSDVWAAHADGSLRNGGIEFVTRPIAARDAPFALHDLFSGGADSCCFTPRTSVHVHVNCIDLTKDRVLDVVLLYLHLERALYRFVGRQRIKNIYCVPLNETSLINSLLTCSFVDRVQAWKKYTGLNLLPLQSQGTIEFRQMHGSNDARKLCVWIRMLLKMFDYCERMGTTQLRKMLSESRGVMAFNTLVQNVFGADAIHLTNYKDDPVDLITAKQAWIKGVKTSELGLDSYSESPFFKFKRS